MHIKKGMGLVNDVFKDGLKGLDGYIAAGHVRYSTTGAACPTMYSLSRCSTTGQPGHEPQRQPDQRGGTAEGTGCGRVVFQTTIDSEVVLSLIARSRKKTLPERVAEAADTIKGAFAILIMNDSQLIAFRDLRVPAPVPGPSGPCWVVASETCAWIWWGPLCAGCEAGEMIVIDDEEAEPRSIMYSTCKPAHCAHCIFEYVYFARPDSIIDGESVYQARLNMGRILARETKDIKADVVISVPDSGTPAAIGYGLEAGIPFVEGLTKNKYIGRTFIQPTQKQRLNAVRLKLNANRSLVAGKSVVMVDDSIVRGTTSGKIVQLLRDAGATAVHVCISSPPVMDSCFYGIDTSERKELIAASKTEEEIRQYIKADSLHYITMEGLRASLSVLKPDDMCYACFNSHYPDGADKEMKKGSKLQFELGC